MKNITITLDEEVARWARVYAAERDSSVSRVLGEVLKEKMESESAYGRAMDRYLSRESRKLKKRDEVLPDRHRLHER